MTLRLGLGPVFAYEWLRATRRWTMYAWRAGFVLVLLGGLALVWLAESQRNGPFTMQAPADLAKMFFAIIECVAVVTVLLAAPAATAGVICQEMEDAGPCSMCSPPTNSLQRRDRARQARRRVLLPVLATIAAALPVLALMRLLGGIDPGALGGSFAVADPGWASPCSAARSPCRSRSGAGRPTRCCWRCTSSGSAGCCSCRSGSW